MCNLPVIALFRPHIRESGAQHCTFTSRTKLEGIHARMQVGLTVVVHLHLEERVASVFVLLYQQLRQYLYFCTSQPGRR